MVLLNLKKIEEERKKQKKSVTEMGVIMGMNGASYWKKENGIYTFSANELPILLSALGKSVDEMPSFFLDETLPYSK